MLDNKDLYRFETARRKYTKYTEQELIKEKEALLKWIDAHDLTPEERADCEYLGNIIDNFFENKEK